MQDGNDGHDTILGGLGNNTITGNAGDDIFVIADCGLWPIQIVIAVRASVPSNPNGARWVVERTFAWFGNRRLTKDFEATITSAEACRQRPVS